MIQLATTPTVPTRRFGIIAHAIALSNVLERNIDIFACFDRLFDDCRLDGKEGVIPGIIKSQLHCEDVWNTFDLLLFWLSDGDLLVYQL